MCVCVDTQNIIKKCLVLCVRIQKLNIYYSFKRDVYFSSLLSLILFDLNNEKIKEIPCQNDLIFIKK